MFKPLLAPNDLLIPEAANALPRDEYCVQYKIDGIRAFSEDGDFLSRSRKPHGNRNLREWFDDLFDYLYEETPAGVRVDGELYSRSVPFEKLSGIIRSHEQELPEDLVFIIFDIYDEENPTADYETRYNAMHRLFSGIPRVELAENLPYPEDFTEAFDMALEAGFEGLMVKKLSAAYKKGRGTYKQGIIFKMKPYETFDSVITGIQQATEVDPAAEKKVNELGRSETSKKKGDRVPIQSASAVMTTYNDLPIKVALSSLTHEERKEIWQEYLKGGVLGWHIEWKGMVVGAKDLPRHPIWVRRRKDLD